MTMILLIFSSVDRFYGTNNMFIFLPQFEDVFFYYKKHFYHVVNYM